MRALLVAMVLVGCGAKSAPTRSVSNTPATHAKPWTLARVLDTLPRDVDIVVFVDLERFRRSALVAPHWKEILRFARENGTGLPSFDDVCPHLADSGSAFVMALSAGAQGYTASTWMLDVPAQEVRDCTIKLVKERPDTGGLMVSTEDYVQSRLPTKTQQLQVGTLVVDPRTVLWRLAPTMDRAAAERATKPAARPLGSSVVDALVAERPTLWGVVRPHGPELVAALGDKLVQGLVTIEVTSRVEVLARVQVHDAAAGQALASQIRPYLANLKQMGWLDAGTVKATHIEVELRAVLERETIERLIGLAKSRLPGP